MFRMLILALMLLTVTLPARRIMYRGVGGHRRDGENMRPLRAAYLVMYFAGDEKLEVVPELGGGRQCGGWRRACIRVYGRICPRCIGRSLAGRVTARAFSSSGGGMRLRRSNNKVCRQSWFPEAGYRRQRDRIRCCHQAVSATGGSARWRAGPGRTLGATFRRSLSVSVEPGESRESAPRGMEMAPGTVVGTRFGQGWPVRQQCAMRARGSRQAAAVGSGSSRSS